MRRRFFAFALALTLTPSLLHAGDWPTYRGDNSRTAASKESLQFPLATDWTYTPPARPRMSWSGPTGRTIEGKVLRDRVNYDDAFHVAVVDGRVYFGSSADHQVHCRELKTGKPIWSFTTGGPVRLAPTVSNGQVFFGSDDGRAYCLNAGDGKLVWKLRAGPSDEWLLARGEMVCRWPVRTGVLVDDGVAYFGAGIFPHDDVFVYAVDAKSGRVIWKRDNISESDAGRNDLSPQGYLLVNKTTLFVPSGRSLPAAIDRKTGRSMFKATGSWRGNAGGVVGGTKALLADDQLLSGGAHHFVTINQKTGKMGFGYFQGKEMAIDGDSAYVATGTVIAKINRAEYAAASRDRQKWEQTIKSLARRLRGKTKNAKLMRAKVAELKQKIKESALTGVKWSRKSGLEDAILIAGKTVFAGGKDKVAAFDAKTGKDVWSMKVEGGVRGLAVSNGRLLTSTTTGKIYCFAHKAGGQRPIKAGGSHPAGSNNARVADPYPKDAWTAKYAKAAEQIIKQTGVKTGFCLVVGADDGRLAYEIAKRSDLKIYGIEPDAKKVRNARDQLQKTGYYGHRIAIHQADLNDIPYSNYFANLIVSDTQLRTGKPFGDPKRIVRHLKPVGGVLCLGGVNALTKTDSSNLATWLKKTQLDDAGKLSVGSNWVTLTRGKLPGAGNWSHLYGDSGNTASTDDVRVTGGLGVLWFGDPGPGEMVNRHDGAVGPLAVNGKLFVQGDQKVMAYDAYNGQFLWEFGNKEALRTGVFQNYNPGNLVAGEDSLFVMVKNRCVELDAQTGKVRAIHGLPKDKSNGKHQWGFVAYNDGILYGTATVRTDLKGRARRRGRRTADATDAVFAIDTKTGKHLWTYQGKSISHRTVAFGPNRAYFVDATLTPEQRDEFLQQDKSKLKGLKGAAKKKAEAELKRKDLRRAVAINARTGKVEWSKPIDVTDCSNIGTGGGELTLMYKNNVLVFCGANANGHYWRQFMSGEFKQRRLLALSAVEGKKMWSRDANYRHRPIIVEDKIIAEPWGFDLYTGEQKMRPHPLTGKKVPWSIIRPGHHCGMLTGSPNMLMFRSGYTGFYDLKSDSGTRHFAGHRLGCWINAIPANGLVMIPEASAGCVCLFSIAATITMEPRKARRPWTIYSAIGKQTPVQHMHLNLGAPGDRKDARGTVWLAYPRPNPHKTTGLDLKLNFKETKLAANRGGYTSQSERSLKVATKETPWVYNSTARSITSWTFPLLGKKDKPGVYTVKLHFAELDDKMTAGKRVFDVKVQGKTVLKDVDVAKLAGGIKKGITREIKGIKVKESLKLELVPKSNGGKSSPILNGVEIIRTDQTIDANQ